VGRSPDVDRRPAGRKWYRGGGSAAAYGRRFGLVPRPAPFAARPLGAGTLSPPSLASLIPPNAGAAEPHGRERAGRASGGGERVRRGVLSPPLPGRALQEQRRRVAAAAAPPPPRPSPRNGRNPPRDGCPLSLSLSHSQAPHGTADGRTAVPSLSLSHSQAPIGTADGRTAALSPSLSHSQASTSDPNTPAGYGSRHQLRGR
jgi:hypothetical protein